MSEQYDDLLPVCLHKSNKSQYWLLDRHNDSIAKFDPNREIEEMERIVALINKDHKSQIASVMSILGKRRKRMSEAAIEQRREAGRKSGDARRKGQQ